MHVACAVCDRARSCPTLQCVCGQMACMQLVRLLTPRSDFAFAIHCKVSQQLHAT